MTETEMLFYFIVCPLWALIATALLVFLILLMKGPAWEFLKAKLFRSKVPVVVHTSTGELVVKLASEEEDTLNLGDHHYVLLPNPPANPSSGLRKFLTARAIWRGLNRPGYFVDATKAVAITPNAWKLISEVHKEKEKNKEKVKVFEGLVLSFEDIKTALKKMYKPSQIRSIALRSEEIGRRKAGFDFGRFAVPFGTILAIGLIFLLAVKMFGLA